MNSRKLKLELGQYNNDLMELDGQIEIVCFEITALFRSPTRQIQIYFFQSIESFLALALAIFSVILFQTQSYHQGYLNGTKNFEHTNQFFWLFWMNFVIFFPRIA